MKTKLNPGWKSGRWNPGAGPNPPRDIKSQAVGRRQPDFAPDCGAAVPRFLRRWTISFVLLFLALWRQPCLAVVPEPDNVAYGRIFLGTNYITAQRTNVVVEVRRAGHPTVLTSYRMGANPAYGSLYVVEIRVGDGVTAPTNGTVLDLVVKEDNAERARTNFLVGGPTRAERGYVQQIDFGTNNLTGFDAWLVAYRLDGAAGNQDADHDGSSNEQEYLAGTNPTNAASKFLLHIVRANDSNRVSFDAIEAQGEGYANRTRHYALERLTDLSVTNWQTVTGYSDIVAANQEVVYSTSASGAPGFFRGKVWLEVSGEGLAADFRLRTSYGAGQLTISFTAAGPDTQGRNHYYTLEQTTKLNAGGWIAVPGYSNVLGADQVVTHAVPATGSTPRFYRGRFELRSP